VQRDDARSPSTPPDHRSAQRQGARQHRVNTMYTYSKDPTRSAAFAAASTYAQAKSGFAAAAAWLAQSWLGRTALALLRDRQERLAMEELKSWDNHMLRDIGLERMQIEPVVRGEFSPVVPDRYVPRPPPQSV
jgi:uncharacterized protein YjiS (DUF1127 family)